MKKIVVDIDKFHEFVSNDKDQCKEMASLFILQAEEYLQELVSAHEHDALDEWRDVTHKFKGMAGFVGAVGLYESCLQAQNDYKADRGVRAEMLNAITQDVAGSVQYFNDHMGV